jgi:hypothetical protein
MKENPQVEEPFRKIDEPIMDTVKTNQNSRSMNTLVRNTGLSKPAYATKEFLSVSKEADKSE